MEIHTLFDKPYSKKKQAEGIAVTWAVASGACNKCRHLQVCRCYTDFVPPGTAACMTKKAEILRGMEV